MRRKEIEGNLKYYFLRFDIIYSGQTWWVDLIVEIECQSSVHGSVDQESCSTRNVLVFLFNVELSVSWW